MFLFISCLYYAQTKNIYFIKVNTVVFLHFKNLIIYNNLLHKEKFINILVFCIKFLKLFVVKAEGVN